MVPVTPSLPPLPTPLPASLSAWQRARICWLRFEELARATQSGQNQSNDGVTDIYGQQMIADHRAALDELAAAGTLSIGAADLVHEAYAAAAYHVWRSNAPITCYQPMRIDYAPTSAAQLVQQAEILADLAEKGELDPQTLALASQTIEHDLAFEALTDEEVTALYQKLLAEARQNQTEPPTFEALELPLTPEMEEAAQFIIQLLTSP